MKTKENADAVKFFQAIGMVIGGFFVAFLLLCALAPVSAWKDADAEIAAIAEDLRQSNLTPIERFIEEAVRRELRN